MSSGERPLFFPNISGQKWPLTVELIWFWNFRCSPPPPARNFFAQGAVSLLDGIGAVTHLCFGSEEGEISGMLSAARILNEEPKEYQEALRHFLCEGYSFPYARNQAFLRYSKSIPSSAGTEEITRLFLPRIISWELSTADLY